MEIGILGPVWTVAGGRLRLIRAKKVRTMLAVLALHPGRVVLFDELTDELWPESSLGNARNALQANALRLRKQLEEWVPGGGRLVRTVDHGYILDIAPHDVDANRFAEQADRGAGLVDRRPDLAVQELRAALALWRGPALFDTEMGLRCRAAAVSLSERRAAAQEDLIAAQINCGRERLVVPELRRLVAQHPERERLSEQLMLALYRSGRQTEALEVFHTARRWLSNELGVEAGHALHSMYRAILNQDPVLAQPIAS
ncbi:AfsR/SARP family transcriptional regulator [Nonomuraea sp. B12E4]|uniref:AfsR/SARP family transcriptional regulator n=1 Tax=Nonomuraea sp. B12E4 TaxID=3153564 RepID=UPI00325F30AB